jgi:ribose-phosphate pyrophosphokinase
MLYQEPEAKIFACSQSVYLAEQIAEKYGVPLGKITFSKYSDGEFQPSFEESIRGLRVFLVCSTFPSADNLMELLLMIDAAKRASAKNITVIIPSLCYARQDRKDSPRVPISAKLMADLLTASGANRLISFDLHNESLSGFFNIPVDNLSASHIFVPYIKNNLMMENLIIAAPDVGGSKRVSRFANALDLDFVIIHKERSKPGVVANMKLIGDVTGKDVILFDDMVDTGTTLAKAAKLIMEQGAQSVRAMCTHAILSGDAYNVIEDSVLTELIVTDTLPLKQHSDKISVLSIDKMLSSAIKRITHGKSISSELFGSM